MDNESAEDPLEICAFSGQERPRSEMLQYGEQFVAPEHKDQFVQLLREGGDLDDDELDCDFTPTLLLSDILRQSFAIWRAQWKEIIVMFVIIWIPLALISEYVSFHVLGDDLQSVSKSFRLDRALETWIGSLVTGAILSMTARRWRGGDRVSFSGMWSLGGANYGRLLGTRFLFGLAILGALIPFGIVLGLSALYAPDYMIAISIIVGIPAVILLCVLMARLGFIETSALSREEGGSPAFSDSWKITKGHFWIIVGFQLLVFTTLTVFVILITLPTLIPGLDNFVVSALFSVIGGIILTYGTVETTVFYQHLAAKYEEENGTLDHSKIATKL